MSSPGFVVFVLLLVVELCSSATQGSDYLCGISSPLTELRRRRDVEARKGEFPWLAAIYAHNKGKWEHICTGTLVSPHLVLTAAHCMTHNDLKNNPKDIKIGLGKNSRVFDKEERFSLLADVREVVVPDGYKGDVNYYALDVAVIDLAQPVNVSRYLMPACLAWGTDLPVTDHQLGQIAGWWKTTEGIVSDNILTAKFPVLSYGTCVDRMGSKSYRQLLTQDKFCANIRNDKERNIGPPASGAGMTVERDGRHYIIGVLSARVARSNLLFLCNLSYPVHREWLQMQRTRLDNKSP